MTIALLAAAVVIVGALVWLRRTLVVVTVAGGSMRPLLERGDRVLVRRAPLSAIRADQIVVVEPPGGGPTHGLGAVRGPRWMIKRAVALPGDAVPDDLLTAVGAERGAVVPDGKLLVRGDNASSSVDSRAYGYVGGDRVLGIALRRIGPPATARGPAEPPRDDSLTLP